MIIKEFKEDVSILPYKKKDKGVLETEDEENRDFL